MFGRCSYCGKFSRELTWDHMTPLSRGGKDTPSNMTPACLPCNLAKGSLTAEEFLASRMAHQPGPTVLRRNGIKPPRSWYRPVGRWTTVVTKAEELASEAGRLRCPKHRVGLEPHRRIFAYRGEDLVPHGIQTMFTCPFPRCNHGDSTYHEFSAAVRKSFRQKLHRIPRRMRRAMAPRLGEKGKTKC